MKVVKEGSLTKQVTCKKCKTELEYEPEDVKHISYEDSPMVYYIDCPFCKKKLGPNLCTVYVPSPSKES